MNKIIVLMSTYNGEKYLQEQIESLLNQVNVKIEILVRDDGSSDKTIDILKKYSDKYDYFNFYRGKNIGPSKSFLELVSKAPIADYYAFCDQDDVWDSCKLMCALEKISDLDSFKPNLYFSNLRIVSSNLKFFRKQFYRNILNDNKYDALVENKCAGCTAVFNYTAKQMISEHIPEYCTMHDYWLYLLCKLLGNVIYDSNAYISYRQHNYNAVGESLKKNSFSLAKKRFLRLFKRDYQPRLMNAVNFEKSFGNYLDEYSKQKIHKMVCYKSSLRNRIALLFDKDIKSDTFGGNMRFKFHVIWGTV